VDHMEHIRKMADVRSRSSKSNDSSPSTFGTSLLDSVAPHLHSGSQNLDGYAHLTYFAEGFYSFCWSGFYSEPIEVSTDGYGEPPRWTFELDAQHNTGYFLARVEDFQNACDTWLTAQRADPASSLARFEHLFNGE
jgi:hypothetical protein